MILGAGMRRAGVAVVDQAIYSLANFGLTVVVARETSQRQFGAYALILAVFIIVSGTMRGLTSEPFIIRFSNAKSHHVWNAAARSALGVSLVVGVGTGLALIATGLLVGGPVSGVAISFGVTLPGVLLQDNWRYVVLADRRPGAALANDVIVTAAQFACTGGLLFLGRASAMSLILVWGGATSFGAVLFCLQNRLTPGPLETLNWLRSHGDLAWRYAADDFIGISAIQVTSFVLAGVAGLAAAGALRGGQTVFGPLLVVNSGVTAAVTPELIRSLPSSPRRTRRRVYAVSAFVTAISVVWGLAALEVPTSVGGALFGATWVSTRPLLLYILIAQAMYAWRVGPVSGLRALGAAARTLRARVWVTAVSIAVPTIGAATNGALGAAIGLAIAAPAQSAIYWWQFAAGWNESLGAPPAPAGQDDTTAIAMPPDTT